MEEKEPGWYPDPDDPDSLRHWDGSEWSDSLFDDIASVAVVESRDPGLFLDEVDRPARVALPGTEPERQPASVRSTTMAVGDVTMPTEPPPAEPMSELASEPAEPEPPDLEEPLPTSSWDSPRRGRIARMIFVAASVIAVAMVGVLVWQLLDDGGSSDSSTEAVVADEPVAAEETPAATVEPEPSPEPTTEPVEASPSSAGAEAEDPEPTSEPEVVAPPPDEPALAEANVLVETARLRADPALDSAEVGIVDSAVTPQVAIVGEPSDGWRQVIMSGWIWGAFVAPAPTDQIVARTINGADAVLRDADGIPTGAPAFGGSYILVMDGSEDLWRIILPEGGFAYVDSAEFDLVLF